VLIEELLEDLGELALIPTEGQVLERNIVAVLELVHTLHVVVENLVNLVREQLVLPFHRDESERPDCVEDRKSEKCAEDARPKVFFRKLKHSLGRVEVA
jgi:hypothetical protein